MVKKPGTDKYISCILNISSFAYNISIFILVLLYNHLVGMFNQTTKFLEAGIELIKIFDLDMCKSMFSPKWITILFAVMFLRERLQTRNC